MSSKTPTIEALRREIDQIDDALHDLIMRRAEVVRKIALTKAPDRPIFRPGREAEIVRRLVARHRGPFPVNALTRIWREMISAYTRLQGPFAVAVFAPEESRGYWDLARDHYGSFTPMQAVNSPVGVLRALTDGSAQVGVVPWPDEDENDPWWRYLLSEDAKTPRIVARLPFCGTGNGRMESGDALAVACVPFEPTGDDHTLLGLELAGDVSRGRLKDMLEASGLQASQYRTYHLPGGGGSVHLVEVESFVDGADQRLDILAQRLGDALVKVMPVGVYATPLAADHRRG
jgi:chorismate mutase-like protein